MAQAARGEVQAILAKNGFETFPNPRPDTALGFKGGGRRLVTTDSFNAALFEMMNAGSQAIVETLAEKPGMCVLDYCAGTFGREFSWSWSWSRSKSNTELALTETLTGSLQISRGMCGWPDSVTCARQAEVGSERIMLDRSKVPHDINPERLIAGSTGGSGPMLGWLGDHDINPQIPVLDKASRTDGTWSRTDFEADAENQQYICPEGESLKQFRRNCSETGCKPTGKGVAK